MIDCMKINVNSRFTEKVESTNQNPKHKILYNEYKYIHTNTHKRPFLNKPSYNTMLIFIIHTIILIEY